MSFLCTSSGLLAIFLAIAASFVFGLSMTLIGMANEVIYRRPDPFKCYVGLIIMLINTVNLILFATILR